MEPSWLPRRTSKKHRFEPAFFWSFRIAWKEHKKDQVVPKMEMFTVEGELISGQALKKSGLWTICKFEGRGVHFFIFKISWSPKENGDLVSWEPPHYSKLFWKNTCWAVTSIKDTLHSTWNTGVGRRSFPFGRRSWILGSVLLQSNVCSLMKSQTKLAPSLDQPVGLTPSPQHLPQGRF